MLILFLTLHFSVGAVWVVAWLTSQARVRDVPLADHIYETNPLVIPAILIFWPVLALAWQGYMLVTWLREH